MTLMGPLSGLNIPRRAHEPLILAQRNTGTFGAHVGWTLLYTDGVPIFGPAALFHSKDVLLRDSATPLRTTNVVGRLRGVFFDLDAQRFEELQVLIADFEFWIGAEGGDERGLVGGFVARLADADGGFEHQKNIVTAFFDAGDDFGNLVGVGQRLIDGFPKFFHQLLKFLV